MRGPKLSRIEGFAGFVVGKLLSPEMAEKYRRERDRGQAVSCRKCSAVVYSQNDALEHLKEHVRAEVVPAIDAMIAFTSGLDQAVGKNDH